MTSQEKTPTSRNYSDPYAQHRPSQPRKMQQQTPALQPATSHQPNNPSTPTQEPTPQQSPTQHPPSQQPSKQHPTPATTAPPNDHYDQSLVLHLCNLLNAASASLNVYNSLEPLARLAAAGQLYCPSGTINMYLAGMQSQAMISNDMTNNIVVVHQKLVHSELHRKVVGRQAYESLLEGASCIRSILNDIPTQYFVPTGPPGPVLTVLPLPPIEAATRMQAGCSKLAGLSDGTKGVVGWNQVLKCVDAALQ